MKMLTLQEITDSTKASPKKIVVTCANNLEALSAVKIAMTKGFLESGYLIGKKTEIESVAKEVDLDVSLFEVIDCEDPVKCAEMSVKLLSEGKGHYLLKGQVDTKTYMKALLNKEYQMVEPGNLLSHIAYMELDEYYKPFIITDCGINIEPDVEGKLKIIKNAVDIAKKLGVEKPKVSLVCAVEKVNPKMKSTVHAKEVVELAQKEGYTDAVIEGPYDIYISMSKEAAEIKGAKGEVAGSADILVFHDINAANATYKVLQLFSKNPKAATIIAGAKNPVILPSRTDSKETKLLSLILSSYLSS